MEREALKLALETLKWANKEINEWMDDAQGLEQEIMLAITAIKKALAQPAQDMDYWIREATAARQAEMALRRELEAQPVQEPVAWAVQGCSKMWRGEFAEIDAKAEAKRIGGTCVAYALYTAPPKREWVGLTDEEIRKIHTASFGKDIGFATGLTEAKLKEKNA